MASLKWLGPVVVCLLHVVRPLLRVGLQHSIRGSPEWWQELHNSASSDRDLLLSPVSWLRLRRRQRLLLLLHDLILL